MRKRVSPRTSAGNGSSERFDRRGRRQLQNRRGPRRSRLPGAEQQVPILDLSLRTEEEIRERLDALRKRYYDATHHCYAWRLGPRGEAFRANDDGEPSGTAGKPILGQLLSNDITDCLVVVVRYFGGTKLGVPGLIAAYRESAAEAIAAAEIVELTVDRTVRVDFPYVAMNAIMRVVKEQQPRIEEQTFDNLCTMRLAIRESRAAGLIEKLRKAGGSVRDEAE